MELSRAEQLINWWVLQTKPRAEEQALRNLAMQGMTTYCPMFTKESMRRQKVKLTSAPLFPRYVFVRTDEVAVNHISAIRSTPGVSQLLKIGAAPAVLNGSIIDHLKKNEELQNSNVERYFQHGDRITVTEGIYKGLEGIYQIDDVLSRAVIFITLMQQETALTLPKQQLHRC